MEEIKEEKSAPKLIEMVDRLEKANKEASEILKRNEEIVARNLLGGETQAGKQPEKPKEETPSEYAKRLMSGRL